MILFYVNGLNPWLTFEILGGEGSQTGPATTKCIRSRFENSLRRLIHHIFVLIGCCASLHGFLFSIPTNDVKCET